MHFSTAVDSTLHSGRPDLAAQYIAVRTTTSNLCAPLSSEDQMVQSMPDASPAKWHQAHTTWFFETFVLQAYAREYLPLDERYRFFFNSYYKQLGGHPVRAQRGLWSRPSLEEIVRYRAHVDEAMLRLLEGPISPEVAQLVTLGCNHEQQHQELIVTDIKHALWTNPLHPAYREVAVPEALSRKLAAGGKLTSREVATLAPSPASDGSTTAKQNSRATFPLRWIAYEGGLHSIGHEGDSFSFDNETPRHRVFLQPFRLASRLVTNAEYLEFMNDRGYSRPELWLSDGWDTINAQGWQTPLYWQQRDGDWSVYTLNGERAVNPAEPVCHISYYEADAYARWAGARLATEFEWETAAGDVEIETSVLDDDWRTNLLQTGWLHPAAVHPLSDNSRPAQLFGDVWEWTASQYLPYPRFSPAAGVVGEYNGKFMCNQFVLRGGSCATPPDHIRCTYRNFFPPHARWQFSGIRLAQ